MILKILLYLRSVSKYKLQNTRADDVDFQNDAERHFQVYFNAEYVHLVLFCLFAIVFFLFFPFSVIKLLQVLFY